MDNAAFALQALFDAHQTIIKYNVDKNTLVFLKHDKNTFEINKEYSVEDFIQNYVSLGVIHPDDLYKFDDLLNIEASRQKFYSGNSSVLFTYRRIENDAITWSKLFISIPEKQEDDFSILLLRRDLSEEETNFAEASSVYSQKVNKIIKHNHSTGQSTILVQRPSERYIRREHSKGHQLSENWLLEETLVHPEDLHIFRHYCDPAVIEKYNNSGNNNISCYYRRKIGGIYHWVRLIIQQANDYTANNKFYLYIIEDVHKELARLFDQQGLAQYTSVQNQSAIAADTYHANLVHILSFLTQEYMDLYMIDLKNDLYITYKLIPDTVLGNFPFVGSYNELCKHYLASLPSDKDRLRVQDYATASLMQEKLMERTSINLVYHHANGQLVQTICTKIESIDGIPTKAISCTIPYSNGNQLQVKTFGNFEVFTADSTPLKFTKKQSKQLFAYLIDKQGYPVTTKDIITQVLERDVSDLNAAKYVSKLARYLMKDLETAGYEDIIVREWDTLRVNTERIDCDYYHLLAGENSYWQTYHNEYMKEYSWAEETNSEILHLSNL